MQISDYPQLNLSPAPRIATVHRTTGETDDEGVRGDGVDKGDKGDKVDNKFTSAF